MGGRAMLLVGTLALMLSAPASASAPEAFTAAASKKCKRAPSAGSLRAPIRDLKAGYATSCRTARKVARAWDATCEITSTDAACGATPRGGERWSCRVIGTDPPLFGPSAPPPGGSHDIFVRCALGETPQGRPSVNFRQRDAIYPCNPPEATRTRIDQLYGYYASCAVATKVARAWDESCGVQEDDSTCDVDAADARWTCSQVVRDHKVSCRDGGHRTLRFGY